jgi:hypothetical protein
MNEIWSPKAIGFKRIEAVYTRAASKYAEFVARGALPGGFSSYRHYNHTGELIYVGVSARIPERLVEHLRSSEWAEGICFVVIEPFASRGKALKAEKDAIRAELPKHNKVYNEGYCPLTKWAKTFELRQRAQQAEGAELKEIKREYRRLLAAGK